jgi:hypothetical protein
MRRIPSRQLIHTRAIKIAFAIAIAASISPHLHADGLPDPGTEAALKAGIDYEGASPEDVSSAGGGSGSDGGALRGPAVVPATLIIQDGDTPTGTNGAITSINAPFTNGLGQVGFTGGADDGAAGTDNYVWYNTGITFLDSDEMAFTLSGAESTMGIGNTGQFVYSPSVDGDDAVWTQNGLLQVEGTQAPGFPGGTINTFNSRPQMDPSGRSYWVSGFNESGGTSTEGRILYTSSNSMPGTITVVLRSDDMIGGFTIDRPSGVDFDYSFSDNGMHHIQTLLMDTGSTADDGFVYVDGALVARETDPTGDGDNWDNFDAVYINDSGNYIFSGDTDGPTATDEFIAYNGSIAVREGDVLDGQPLTSTASVQALSINNLGHAVHHWSISGGIELLFISCDASDIAGTSQLILSTGDQVDLDGNMVGDATVTDFNGSGVIGPSLSLAEDGFVDIEVDLNGGGEDLESTIRIANPCGGGGAEESIARFAVTKEFDDGNPAEVEVTISCNTGLPLQQSQTITGGVLNGVTFVVTDFENGAMDCVVTESGATDGYAVEYFDGTNLTEDGCSFEAVAFEQVSTCEISNGLLPVEVEVVKWWMDENPQFNAVNYAEAVYGCNNEQFGIDASGSLEFFGDGAVDGFLVYPDWDGSTTCWVNETVVDSGVEFDDSECASLSVLPGQGASCAIYNTRLYEGIPTLSQYGLAVLALLMLGLGFVAYRRFV